MIIYEKQPNNEALAKFAFEECPNAGYLHLVHDDGGFVDYAYRDLRGAARPPDNERLDTVNFSVSYLWLMKARQTAWMAEHPHDEMTFA